MEVNMETARRRRRRERRRDENAEVREREREKNELTVALSPCNLIATFWLLFANTAAPSPPGMSAQVCTCVSYLSTCACISDHSTSCRAHLCGCDPLKSNCMITRARAPIDTHTIDCRQSIVHLKQKIARLSHQLITCLKLLIS